MKCVCRSRSPVGFSQFSLLLQIILMSHIFEYIFCRSHMCAVDGKANYLVCPTSCDSDVAFEDCTCKVDALVTGMYILWVHVLFPFYFLFLIFLLLLLLLLCFYFITVIPYVCIIFTSRSPFTLILIALSILWPLGNTTWQNLFPCLLNSKSNQDFFLSSMPEEMISDLIFMAATASVQEVRNIKIFYYLLW